jgi:hypothetical protein
LKKLNDDEYVVVLNFPFRFKLLTDGSEIYGKDGFCKFFKFEKCIQPNTIFGANIDITSENIKEVVTPFSVTEWHCNITEYSYANHDDHSHLHKHDELLHVSFVKNNFYDTPVYKENPNKIMFVPLRKDLQKIREIIITPLDEKNNEIKNLKDVIVYLQLKEE